MRSILSTLGITQDVQNLESQAQQQVQAAWAQVAPYVYAFGFLAVTAWLFYFVPRFRLPWTKAS